MSVARRVLLVDGDAATRARHAGAFRRVRYETIETADGRDALTLALVREPSLIVTELSLPRVDGVALCEVVRSDRALAAVPVVVVTGETDADALRRAAAAGADLVLRKPVSARDLLERSRRLVADAARLHERTRLLQEAALRRLKESATLLEHPPRPTLSKSLLRCITTMPPQPPRALTCPACGRPLLYQHSHVGGVNERHREQWDYFLCGECGQFQYRQRTRTLRKVAAWR